MDILRQNCTKMAAPVGPYVHSVAHQHLLHTSGLTAYGTEAQHGNLCEQTRAIFEQLGMIAEQHGLSIKRLLKVTLFVTDMSDIAALRDTLLTLYGRDIPASSLIKVDGLFAPELKIEIEALFAIP